MRKLAAAAALLVLCALPEPAQCERRGIELGELETEPLDPMALGGMSVMQTKKREHVVGKASGSQAATSATIEAVEEDD
eukprot:CAMPEP_0171188674 /NCGR_PEP_ID=MMETSP0790-20130122/17955_1 /TAXON_ID=2925 /ORGANISM="Alexandrium catenella, Strain OF101" /LENGTH=78 /DNA_ID=CAMNT_0011653767 /DNA_START=94 /DNA_END=333 /DNA_ORIENTATION=+